MDQKTGFATLAQFRELVRASRRRQGYKLAFCIAGLLLMLGGMFVLVDLVGLTDEPVNSPLRWGFVGGLGVTCVVFLFALSWATADQDQDPHCPHCSHRLNEYRSAQYAIITRRCPKCSQPLIDNETSTPPVTAGPETQHLVSRTKLIAAQELVNGKVQRQILRWLISVVLLLLLGSLMVTWVQESLASRLSEVWLPFVRPVLLMPGFVVLGWSLVIEARQLENSRVRYPCPKCSADIWAYGIASHIGNCDTCGQSAVYHPVPGMHPPLPSRFEPQTTLDEFRELAKYRYDRLWIGCLVGGALAAMCAIPLFVWFPSRRASEVSHADIVVFLVATVGIFLVQCGGVWWWHRYSTRGLRCAECSGELVESYRLVISSHRCYHCGCTVLQKPTESVT